MALHQGKVYVQRVSFGIDFGGYRVFSDKQVIRKSTVRRYIRRYKRNIKFLENLRNYLLLGVVLNSPIRFKFSYWIYTITKDHLDLSLCSHVGFLKHALIDKVGETYYSGKVRLPYAFGKA